MMRCRIGLPAAPEKYTVGWSRPAFEYGVRRRGTACLRYFVAVAEGGASRRAAARSVPSRLTRQIRTWVRIQGPAVLQGAGVTLTAAGRRFPATQDILRHVDVAMGRARSATAPAAVKSGGASLRPPEILPELKPFRDPSRGSRWCCWIRRAGNCCEIPPANWTVPSDRVRRSGAGCG